jgi:hypothetical protein
MWTRPVSGGAGSPPGAWRGWSTGPGRVARPGSARCSRPRSRPVHSRHTGLSAATVAATRRTRPPTGLPAPPRRLHRPIPAHEPQGEQRLPGRRVRARGQRPAGGRARPPTGRHVTPAAPPPGSPPQQPPAGVSGGLADKDGQHHGDHDHSRTGRPVAMAATGDPFAHRRTVDRLTPAVLASAATDAPGWLAMAAATRPAASPRPRHRAPWPPPRPVAAGRGGAATATPEPSTSVPRWCWRPGSRPPPRPPPTGPTRAAPGRPAGPPTAPPPRSGSARRWPAAACTPPTHAHPRPWPRTRCARSWPRRPRPPP